MNFDNDHVIDGLSLSGGSRLNIVNSGFGDLEVQFGSTVTDHAVATVGNGRTLSGQFSNLIVSDGGALETLGTTATIDFNYIDLNGGTLRAAQANSSAQITTAQLLVSNFLSCPGGGLLTLSGTMSLNAAYLDIIALDCATSGGLTPPRPPRVRVASRGPIEIFQACTLQGNVGFSNASSASMLLGGNFNNQSTSPELFEWTSGALETGLFQQTFEVAGQDLGPSLMGFQHADGHSNFSMPRIDVFGQVTFRNGFPNQGGSGPCGEALYVHTLYIAPGAVVMASDCKVYYQCLVGGQGQTTTVGCGAFVRVAGGDADCDRVVTLHDADALLRGACITGPRLGSPNSTCQAFDFDASGRIDLRDIASFQNVFGPHDCCAPGGPGCREPSVQACVCNLDPSCCSNEWDAQCVGRAFACGACLGDHPCEVIGDPGCDTRVIQDCVCCTDPLCCSAEWNENCVARTAECYAFFGNCFEPHESVGCENLSCSQEVCLPDPFCCQVRWDYTCAYEALQVCEGCP